MTMPASDRPVSFIPSVRARRLAAALKAHREAAGLTLAAVAASVGWSTAKVGHVETLTRPIDSDDVALLLELYGVSDRERAELLEVAREARRRNWWNEYIDVLSGAYVALEDGAARIDEWCPLVVPGLLQTPDYARGILSGGRTDAGRDAERRLQARLVRQAILTREDAPHLTAILDEAVLERPVGGRSVMVAQLRKLIEESERENVTLRVLPKSVGTHAGLEGALILLTFAEPEYPDVAYCEGFFGSTYLESAPKVAVCRLAIGQLRQAALDPAASVARIRAAADAL